MSQDKSLLDNVQALLDRRVSIRQLVQLGIVAAAVAGMYLLIGLFWANSHSDHLDELHGLDKLFSAVGEVVAWPVLIIADIDLR